MLLGFFKVNPSSSQSRFNYSVFFFLALILNASVLAATPEVNRETLPSQDPFAWLEQISSERSIQWVQEQNALTRKELASDPNFLADRNAILEVLNNPARIPLVQRMGDYLYQIHRDGRNKIGLWRRTTLASYVTANPSWEVMIDLDELAGREKINWVWGGASCLAPEYRRCMVGLSKGGADARVLREFDLNTRQFVEAGFSIPEAKTQVVWLDANSLLVMSDFGAGTLTSSGYARQVRLWKRGTALSQASLMYEAEPTDVSAWAFVVKGRDGRGRLRQEVFVSRSIDFMRTELFHIKDLDKPAQRTKINLPETARWDFSLEHAFITLKSDWQVADQKFSSGSLLATSLQDLIGNRASYQLLFQPTATRALVRNNPVKMFADGVMLAIQDNVRDAFEVWQFDGRRWRQNKPASHSAALPLGTAAVTSLYDPAALSADFDNRYFYTYADFLTPSQLRLGDFGADPAQARVIKTDPEFFSAEGMRAEQRFVRAKDGVSIPYFIVFPKDYRSDRRYPTLLTAYGGFQVAQRPVYSGSRGRAWLAKGGVLVVANIRGGGEFGPAWHQAALREKRQTSYDDLIAVAEDLIRSGVTIPSQLALQGGSQGGLLVASVMLQRPELFGAVVCQVPLLDMRNYHRLLAGHSWVAEYGDPDRPEQWAYISKYSPYHNLQKSRRYPRVLFITSTRDDRVHPGHARKMAALMQAQGRGTDEVLFYENVEGGHSAAANNEQRADLSALEFAFLWQTLKPAPTQTSAVTPPPLLTTTMNIAANNPETNDPRLYLEEVNGERAMAWVREQNKTTMGLFENRPEFKADRETVLKILNSRERIQPVTRRGDYFYNLLQDDRYKVGLWRRTPIAEYQKPVPDAQLPWETLLDLDQLAKDEKQNWVWGGAVCNPPDYQRCLISLSRGGADAKVIREFDLRTRQFVPGGFELPEAKSSAGWLDADTLYISTDFGTGSLTASGYARIVKLWKRGTPLSQAQTIFEARQDDVGVFSYADRRPGSTRFFVGRYIDFYRSETFFVELSRGTGPSQARLTKLAVPEDADLRFNGDWVFVQLRSPLLNFPAGSLLASKTSDLLAGKASYEALFTPTPTRALASDGAVQFLKDGVLVTILDNVSGRLEEWRVDPKTQRWTKRAIQTPSPGDLWPVALHDPFAARDALANHYLLNYTDFLTPSSLYLGQLGSDQRILLKRNPVFFDSHGMRSEQRLATSADGTRIPYFVVYPKGYTAAQARPTLLYGYGGFQVSLSPWYSGAWGKTWYERGGVLVVANIRGGGEFGPQWHQAAIKENKQKSYDDFIAVAQDLIQAGITTPRQLGIMGGSNGGLLVAAVMLQKPELFGAVVSQVPLLDMQRYHKLLAGHSWMAEYGDPDQPSQWAYIRRYSPYQNVRAGVKYPRVLFHTSTRDDRVHPGHARKMAALMQSQGRGPAEVLYFENIEGGHSAAANNEQRAHLVALEMQFLWDTLNR